MDGLTNLGKNSPIKSANRFLEWCRELVQTLFQMLLITYLMLILLETIFEGSVSSYINMNYLLIIIIVVGVVAVLMEPIKAENIERKHLNRKSIFLMFCAGIVGATIIWYKTQGIGWLAYVVSTGGGVLILLLPMLAWGGSREGSNEEGNS